MRSEVYPQDWKSSFVIPLFKDGDPESASNYRHHKKGSWHHLVVSYPVLSSCEEKIW